MVSHSILIVDDEEDILDFIEYNLKAEGYNVLKAENGKKALELAEKNKVDLILLDIMMPEMDGIEVCKRLREKKSMDQVVIAFLTAKREDMSLISGLDAGADDYLTKPVKPKVLMSKIASLLRRVSSEDDGHVRRVSDLEIDKEKYEVRRNGEVIIFPRKEFELLSLLTSRTNKVFTRDEIYNKIWDSELIVGMRTIDVHIRKIREKIGNEHIRTVKGIGYKFVE